MEYRLKEITPESEMCVGLACPSIHLLEITPKSEKCGAGPCPGVYELRRATPSEVQCGVGACPEIYEQNVENYLIIGKLVAQKDFGLEKKVGEGEVLISVPKKLIDLMEKK